MIDFLTYIYEILVTSGIKVYQEQLPEKEPETNLSIPFPYIVFKAPNSTPNEFRDDIVVEVDIWDNKSDTTQLETITNDIDKKLNRLKYFNQKFQTSLYRIGRLTIPDPDITIRRRQLRYLCKTYFVEEELL